ncbi:MAG: hypothetical protein U1E05_05575, partial [Patescibacteria group bacterium]|nr:hypothetical protein [Patescibacteria group bacterium]
SRDLVTHEATIGWFDTHNASKFVGATSVEVGAGAVGGVLKARRAASLADGAAEAAATLTAGVPSAGARRAAQYGSNWQRASLERAISRHAGKDYTSWITKTGKQIFENPATGRQVVLDIDGGYFRVFQPKAVGSSQGTYLNMLGREVTPAMRGQGGAINCVPLRDVNKGAWQAETHFWLE